MRADKITYRCETEDGLMHHAEWRDNAWRFECDGPYTMGAKWFTYYPVLTCVVCAARAR